MVFAVLLTWLPSVLPSCHALAAQQELVEPGRAEARDDAGGTRFDVFEFRIEGNTKLASMRIERAVYPFLGERRTIKDVEQAREALEKAYHTDGYLTALVDIPEQQVDSGIVVLKVAEAPVERLRVVGSKYYSLGKIREKVAELAEGNVPHFPTMQAQLATLNRTPDRRVQPVLRPGRTPGTVDVDLNVEDKLPLHAGVELNNRYSQSTSPLRLSGYVRYDNLWQREHSLALNAQVTPSDTSEVRVASATYSMPLGDDSVFSFYAVRSLSDVASVGTLNVLGTGTIYGLRLVTPIPSAPNTFHAFTFGIDRKEFGETVNLAPGTGFNTPISYTPMLVQYALTRQGEGRATQFSIGANFAMRGWFGNSEAEFANKRFHASANYLVLKADLQHRQDLPKGFSISGRLDGQASNTPLVSNEQFVAGGADTVRGYREAERFGDHGLHLGLELRSPKLFGDMIRSGLQLIAFYDHAALRLRDPLPDTASRFTLASAGVGLRLKPMRETTIDIDYAEPLRDGQYTRANDWRIHFRVAYEF